ncbi:MAG TPA: tRNA epoxyqueuosine(34) reductase QueG [Candidatus Limnocylindria bacterium]|nr:tRNA epoxyqueuosine(34) reductase QueG [Candidatus Limnocylindria bacterium]
MTPRRALVARLAARHGLELLGIAAAEPLPDARARMEEAVAGGRMATMGWMGGERAVTATDPRRLDPRAASVVVVAAPYVGPERAAWDPAPDHLASVLAPVLSGAPTDPAGLVARYAVGTDYHAALRSALDALAAELRAAGLGVADTAYVDDRPLAERAFAARAGLGWIGKNTNLLTHLRAGSWVLLGALLVHEALPADEPIRSSCGACTRCLDGCPTGALIAPQVLDARRCISYLTIEHPGAFAGWEARAVGSWVFGCDVCQAVCPVNAEAVDVGPLRVPLIPLVAWLLPLGARAFERAVGVSPLRRAGRHRLLRNALAALGNGEGPLPAVAARLVERAAADRRPEVRAAAQLVSPRLTHGAR